MLAFAPAARELQVSYPPEGNQVRRITNLLGSSRLLAKQEAEHKQSTRVPQGRIERRGSLIGWQPPYGPMMAFRYTARAYRFSQLFSIRRAAMREVLETHMIDAHIWQKAVEHANKLLQPSKSSRSLHGAEQSKRSGETSVADDAFRRVSESTGVQSADDEAKAAAARGGFLPPAYAQLRPNGSLPSPLSPGAAALPSSLAQQSAALQPTLEEDYEDGSFSQAASNAARSASQVAAERPSAAWMAAREQAEAALRADLQAVRDEVRSGFAQLTDALAQLRAAQSQHAAAPGA